MRNTSQNQLLHYAQLICNEIGIDCYDPSLSQAEFYGYLKSQKIRKRLTQNLGQSSGVGNPFAPIVFVGNELAYNMKKDLELNDIFQSLDEIWFYSLLDPNLLELKKILIKWKGPFDDFKKKHKGNEIWNKDAIIFYNRLREMIQCSNILHTHPFPWLHTQYYSPRKSSGHYWNKCNHVLNYICRKVVLLPNITSQEACKNFTKNNEQNFLSYCFLTEFNLIARKNTAYHNIKENLYFTTLAKSKSQKIIICGSHISQAGLLDFLKKQNISHDCSCNITNKYKVRLQVIRCNNKKTFILTRNLSGSVSTAFLEILADTIVKEGNKM